MGRIIFAVSVGLLGTLVLVSLGIWQVQRLAEKEEILATIESRISAETVAIPQDIDPNRDALLAVRAEGEISATYLRFLVSQKIKGAGYRIVSPFELADGRRVMLDRGFLPVQGRVPAAPEGRVAIEGNLHWPQEIDGFTPQPDKDANIWFARDVPAMAAALGTQPVLIVLREASFEQPPLEPLPVNTEGIPNDHLNYAITWFSLAAIWVGMSAYFLYRQRRRVPNKA